MKSAHARVTALLAKRDALMAKIAKIHSQEVREARRLQTRQKILIGCAFLLAVERNQFRHEQLMTILRDNLTERDLRIFKL